MTDGSDEILRHVSHLEDGDSSRDLLSAIAIGGTAMPPSPDDASLPLKMVHAFGSRSSAREEAEERFGIVARDSFGMLEVGPAMVLPKAAGEKLEFSTCGLAAPLRETRVVDTDGNECPPGEPGELQIRGRSIMLGYHKRPDANAETFDGDWLRSGDLFVKDEDGYNRIVGRLKEMIKRAGENISAREVEAAPREAPRSRGPRRSPCPTRCAARRCWCCSNSRTGTR